MGHENAGQPIGDEIGGEAAQVVGWQGLREV